MYVCILYLHTCPAGHSDSAQFSFSVKQANRVVYRLHLGKTTGIMLIKVNEVPPHSLPFPHKMPKATIVVVVGAAWPLEKDVPNRTSLLGCVCACGVVCAQGRDKVNEQHIIETLQSQSEMGRDISGMRNSGLKCVHKTFVHKHTHTHTDMHALMCVCIYMNLYICMYLHGMCTSHLLRLLKGCGGACRHGSPRRWRARGGRRCCCWFTNYKSIKAHTTHINMQK